MSRSQSPNCGSGAPGQVCPLLPLLTSPEKGYTPPLMKRKLRHRWAVTPGLPLCSPDAPSTASPSLRQLRPVLSAHFLDQETAAREQMSSCEGPHPSPTHLEAPLWPICEKGHS